MEGPYCRLSFTRVTLALDVRRTDCKGAKDGSREPKRREGETPEVHQRTWSSNSVSPIRSLREEKSAEWPVAQDASVLQL